MCGRASAKSQTISKLSSAEFVSRHPSPFGAAPKDAIIHTCEPSHHGLVAPTDTVTTSGAG